MRTVHNDWLKDDIGGVAICGAGRSRPLAKEARAAGADWLCSGPGRPGKGRRRNLSRKSDCEAAAQRQWLSWSRRRRRRGLSTFESRMQVRVGLSLLLCAVLLGSAAATSGQYRASGSRPRATAPPTAVETGPQGSVVSGTPLPDCHSLLPWTSVSLD